MMKDSDKSEGLIKSQTLEDLIYSFDYQKVKRGLGRHLLLVLVFALTMGALGARQANEWMQSYTSETVLVYQIRGPDPFKNTNPTLDMSLQAVVKMITLPKHLNQVRELLNLDLSNGKLKKMIDVQMYGRKSNLLRITTTADSPELALDLANTLADVVVESSGAFTKKQWSEALVFYKNQETELKNLLAAKTRELSSFRAEQLAKGSDVALEGSKTVSSLQDEEMKAKIEREQLLVEYDNLKRTYDSIEPSSLLSLSSRKEQIEEALLEARIRYAQDNPKIKALEEQLKELSRLSGGKKGQTTYDASVKDNLGVELIAMEAKITGLQERQDQISKLLQEKRREAVHASSDRLRYLDLEKERKDLEESILVNQEKQTTLKSMLELGRGALSHYQRAENASQEGSTSLVDLLALGGAILGSIIGLFVAFFVELSDSSIRTPKQMSTFYNIPCFETIPEFFLLNPKNVEAKVSSYIHTIADRLDRNYKEFSSLAITSSVDREGKSMITSQLARFYTEKGKKVIVLECDFRENEYLGPSAAKATLEEYLNGEAQVSDLIERGSFDRIKAEDDMRVQKLIHSEEMNDLWHALTQAYDLIIIDTPGILDNESTLNLLGLAEQSIFILGSEQSKKPFVDASFELLDGFSIQPAGVVLNRVPPRYIDRYSDKIYLRSRKKK